jgi:hypothetical protein
MTLRTIRPHLALVVAAAAAVSLIGGSPARAFTFENQSGSADGRSRFADPDDQVKNFGQGAQPFGQNGPIVQFGAQPGGAVSPFGHSPGAGFAPSPPPPQPYNLNNRND